MIQLIFKITYSHADRAALALPTYRRDTSSVKRIIDNALNLRAKLIFDSGAFQSVALETTIERISQVNRVIEIVVKTNQDTFVSGYEAALNGTTLFVFDGVAKLVMFQFQRDEFLLGDYIQSIFIDAVGAKETKTPVGQVLEPVTEPISNIWESIKLPLIVTISAIALVAVAYFTYKIFELKSLSK